MSRRLTLCVILLSLTTTGAAQAPSGTSGPRPCVVHEWGTFTSIAGPDGRAVEWLPLARPNELPGFVKRFGFTSIKGSLPAKVRMETPVLYFYASGDTTVNVTVRFRQGLVTEWFPRAVVTPADATTSSLRRTDFESSITWSNVKVSPAAAEDFSGDTGGNHYYVARETDASPLRIESDREKFLFYRGLGGFEPPILARVDRGGKIVVTNRQGEALDDVILFANRGGTMAYQIHEAVGGSQIVLDPATAGDEPATPQAELERILVTHGLFPKEAKAMVNTWRDSWFGEGQRIFYIVSRDTINSILPLEIDPTPADVVRVFVGRVELRN